MKKQIEVGLVKSFYIGRDIDAKVVYANEFNAEGFELVCGKTIENMMDMPDGQYNVYRKGVDRKYREADEWFLVYEGDRPEEVKPEPKKQPKLSKTMQEAIDQFHKADWYYMHNGKGCEDFAGENGYRGIGFERSALVEGGYVYGRLISTTVKALEKRGLIEVAKIGGSQIDIVKVKGMELPEKVKKALLIEITMSYPVDGYRPHSFNGYAVNESCIPALIERYASRKNVEVNYKVLGEVELTVWDYFKNK